MMRPVFDEPLLEGDGAVTGEGKGGGVTGGGGGAATVAVTLAAGSAVWMAF